MLTGHSLYQRAIVAVQAGEVELKAAADGFEVGKELVGAFGLFAFFAFDAVEELCPE